MQRHLFLEPINILLVEDMAPMRMITAGLLKHMQFGEVWSVDNGLNAINIVRRYNPDIIITDWHMEPIDGLELVKAIRSDQTMPNRFVPVIMITGFNAAHRVAAARDAGVTEFLIKPFTVQELARRIAYVINKPRDFIEAETYFGPDRRRKYMPDYPRFEKRKNSRTAGQHKIS